MALCKLLNLSVMSTLSKGNNHTYFMGYYRDSNAESLKRVLSAQYWYTEMVMWILGAVIVTTIILENSYKVRMASIIISLCGGRCQA